MKQATLTVTTREGTGRGAARRLRAQGKIPAVIYGKSGVRDLTVDEKDFHMLMRKISGTASLVTLNDDKGGSVIALLQDTQRNPRTDRFEHIDFHEVVKGEKLTAHIPVHTKGEAYGVKNENGVLEIVLHEIEVICLPRQLPEDIELNVSDLHAGDAIHVSDLPKLEGVTYQHDPQSVVVAVTGATGAAEETDAVGEEEAAGSTAG